MATDRTLRCDNCRTADAVRYVLGVGADRRPVDLCPPCVKGLSFADVLALSTRRQPTRRPPLTLTTVEAIEASKRPQKRAGRARTPATPR